MSVLPKKARTVQEENRSFNEKWEKDYFTIPTKDKMLCLLCDLAIATLKNATAKRHYENIYKDHKYAKLEEEARKNALAKLKSQKSKQQQTFSIVQEHGNRATETTYKIALILGKGGKPYSDIETLKACLIEAVSCLDPDKVDKFKQLPLSRRTITDLQHELATNSPEQLISICQMEDAYYLIALDESTYVTDSAQLLLFIRVITADFKSYEELFALATLKGKTRSCDIFSYCC
ncbi:EPM2A-interacting protein 1-like [Hydra vulgaris]|uniref:EPM2A-interacting protein 1-like n=1 Tax=Hydra vulgaris TaxID=6087 RepID=A0ABM4CLT3_HYDVU